MRHASLLVLCIILAHTILYAQAPGTDKLKYSTVATIAEFDYSQAIKNLTGRARIIGMGEAAHGGTEFERIKAALVKTLVQQYGFRHLILEAGVPQCVALNEYICTGTGDPTRIMGIYFPWPYKTKGFLEIVQWLRDYNAGKPITEQVRFYGMDLHATHALPAMRFELKKYGNISGLGDTTLLSELEAIAGTEREKRESLEQLYSKYAQRKDLGRKDSIIALNAIETQICNNISHGGSRYAYRERMLFKYAQMVIDPLPQSEKVMIWAHNNHVSKRSSARKSLGSMLSDAHAASYSAIGFDFGSGSFRANSRDEKSKKYAMGVYETKGSKHALGNLLSELNEGLLGIGVEANYEHPLVDTKQLINSIGAEYNYKSAEDESFYTEQLVLRKSFDYLFIVKEIHPSESI